MMISLVENELACDIYNTIANQRQLVWQKVGQLSEQQYRPFYMPLFMRNSAALPHRLRHHIGGLGVEGLGWETWPGFEGGRL